MNSDRRLISIIRAAFGLEYNEIDLSKEDVSSLVRIARRQSILYIFALGLKNMGYSDLLSEQLKDYCENKTVYDFVQRDEALKVVTKTLEETSVSFIPLKSAVLRELYPKPYMRTSADIDVLVHEDDLKKAVEALESKTAFRCIKRGHHDMHLINQRVHLELHFSLMTNLEKMDDVLGRAWEYSVSIGTGKEYHFSPEYQVFYITAHAAKHFIKEGGVGIRPLIDLWLLRTKTTYDEDAVKSLCKEAGILGFYDVCCDLLSVWFNDGCYSDVTESFEELVFSGGVFGSEHTQIISRRRRNRGAKYALKRVFRNSSDIKELYPKSKDHPILIPYYQVARWTHVLNPAKRRQAREELKHANSIDQAEIEKYDALMKTMGL